jgi:hypothetical protein
VEIRGPIVLRLVEHIGFPLRDAGAFISDDFEELHA